MALLLTKILWQHLIIMIRQPCANLTFFKLFLSSSPNHLGQPLFLLGLLKNLLLYSKYTSTKKMLIRCAVKERSKRKDSLLKEVESKYIPSSMICLLCNQKVLFHTYWFFWHCVGTNLPSIHLIFLKCEDLFTKVARLS